jgi:hypothetical protein
MDIRVAAAENKEVPVANAASAGSSVVMAGNSASSGRTVPSLPPDVYRLKDGTHIFIADLNEAMQAISDLPGVGSHVTKEIVRHLHENKAAAEVEEEEEEEEQDEESSGLDYAQLLSQSKIIELINTYGLSWRLLGSRCNWSKCTPRCTYGGDDPELDKAIEEGKGKKLGKAVKIDGCTYEPEVVLRSKSDNRFDTPFIAACWYCSRHATGNSRDTNYVGGVKKEYDVFIERRPIKNTVTL